jgi:hypothetical protein
VIFVNDDDDDSSGFADRDDSGTVAAEDDLTVAQLALQFPASADLAGFQVKLEVSSGSGFVKAWTSPDKGTEISLPQTFVLGSGSPSSFFPSTVYLEGFDPGYATVDLVLLDPAGNEVARDQVAVAAAQVSIRRGAANITDTTQTVNIGSKIALQAIVSPAGLEITDRQWSIPGTRIANFEYAPGPTFEWGTVTPLTTLD